MGITMSFACQFSKRLTISVSLPIFLLFFVILCVSPLLRFRSLSCPFLSLFIIFPAVKDALDCLISAATEAS